MEGNTRTTAVFIECYLVNMGFTTDNTLFKEHAQYFRNALVRSNFADYKNGIDLEFIFLYRFFGNLLFGEKHALRNRDMMIAAYYHE